MVKLMRWPVFIALGLAACSAKAPPPAPPRPATYIQALDGQTLLVRGERVRISNIDAPRLPPDAKCWAEAALAGAAAKTLGEFINISTAVGVEREGETSERETVARVSADGHDVGEALVFAGVAAKRGPVAWDWCGPSKLSEPDGPQIMAPRSNLQFWDWWKARTGPDAAVAEPPKRTP